VSTAYVPRSLAEALELRHEHPEAVPVAGGTDLMVDVNFGRSRPSALLDLSPVDELRTWRQEGDGNVFVGAGMTFARIAQELGAFRPLVEAARSVGSPQIRNRATLGGNLGTASPAGDSIPVLAAYDAEVLVASVAGTRRIPWDEFLLAPKRTSLRPDELILGAEWPLVRGPGSFAKIGVRNAMVIAVASVCVQLDEKRRRVRLALGSVGPTVLRALAAESFAAAALDWDDPEDALVEFGRRAAAEAQPIDDVRGSAAYRRHAVEVLARRGLAWTLEDRC
jgi:CO/xanthine dehydrogenase FAD-binding subunit